MLKVHWRRLRSRYLWLQMVQTWRFWLLVVFTCVLLLYAIVSFKRAPVTYLQQDIKEIRLGNLDLDFQTGLLILKDSENIYLRGSIPDSHQLHGLPSHCGEYNISKYLCASRYPTVKLQAENVVDEHASCQTLTWTPLYVDYKPHTCFSLADFSWYGGSLLSQQTWPLNKADVPLQPYTTHNLESYSGERTTIGNILDWFFISTSGVAVIIDNAFPIHVSINQSGDKLLCIHSMSVNKPILKYTLCKAANLRKIHRYVITKYIHLPHSLVKETYFENPMWSTFPAFNTTLTQDKLLSFVQSIEDYKFERNIMDIYDNGLSALRGDPFGKIKFRNSHQSLMYVRDAKFETFLPISPFIPVTENVEKSRLIQDLGGNPAVIKYQGEDAYVVNMLDDEALNWYVGRITEFTTDFGANGIHLVGGESDYLNLSETVLNSVDLDRISNKFTKSVTEKLKLPTISTFSSRNQNSAPLIKLTSHVSSWNDVGGLRSVIPSLLTLGILGYPFVIPNVVGGSGSVKVVNSSYSEQVKPERELYIRWMGVAAYMPCMMFSFPPWFYDEEVVNIAREFMRQHKEIVAPIVKKAAREYEISGSPVIRPIWWLDPNDSTAFTIDDEYMIGDSLLVAPVLREGSTSRDIYIPQGRWHDNINNKEVEAASWLRAFHIPLEHVATFTKLKS